MSRHSIDTPILALTPLKTTERKASLYRNVRAFHLEQEGGSHAVLRKAEELLMNEGYVRKGDLIVVTWGSPMGEAGGTNALKIVRVGEYD